LSSNSKAELKRTLVDLMREGEVDSRRLAGLERINFSGISSVHSTPGGTGRRGETPNVTTQQSFLKVDGDNTMVGAISFYPTAQTISAGVIDISQNTTNDYSSNVKILGQTNPDDLDTITGAAHAGQLLYLQAVLTTDINLTNSGNIITPDLADFVIDDGNIVTLIFDSTANKWRVLGGQAYLPLAGGTMTGDINMGLNDIIDVGQLSLRETTTNPAITLFRDDATPTNDDFIGLIGFKGKDDGGNDHTYATIFVESANIADGSERSAFYIHNTVGGILAANEFKMELNEIIFSTTAESNTAITLFRNDSSPTNDDVVGIFNFQGKDSAGNDHTYASIFCESTVVANGSEDGTLYIHNSQAGTLGDNRIVLKPTTQEFVIGNAVQVEIDDGAIYPTTDDDVDLGKSAQQFKDLFIDGSAQIDTLFLSTAVAEGVQSDILPTSTTTFNIGNSTRFWTSVFLSNVRFNASTQFINVQSSVMTFEMADTQSFEWQINNSPQMQLNQTELDLAGNRLIDVLDIEFDDVSNTITADSLGMVIKSATLNDFVKLEAGNAGTEFELNATFVRLRTTDSTLQPQIVLHMNDPSPTAGQLIASLIFDGEDSASNQQPYGRIDVTSTVVTSSSERGDLELKVATGSTGALATGIQLIGDTGTSFLIGFFGTTPVAQQSPAATSAAIITALENLGLFV